jgi:hypothetical protein
MHAISWFEVQTGLEPIFNNEPFAEVSHAYEKFLLDGNLTCPAIGGIWLRQWPLPNRLNGFSRLFAPIHVPTPFPGHQWVDEAVYLRFLLDQFWDTETAPIGNRRCRPFKKLWLRSHHETPTTPYEANFYFTGYFEPPLPGNQPKRRRIADTETKCWRWKNIMRPRLSTGGSLTSRRMRSVRGQEKKEKLEEEFREMKDEFHERELLRLNQAWVALVPRVTFERSEAGIFMTGESWIRMPVEFRLYQHRFCPSVVSSYEYKSESSSQCLPRTYPIPHVICNRMFEMTLLNTFSQSSTTSET